MIDKDFQELSMKEQFKLQGIVKKQQRNQELTAEEQTLYERFSGEFLAAEQSAKSKWPIIIGLIITSALAIFLKQ